LQLIDELKRRNVFRAAIAYLAFGWLLVQISDTVFSGVRPWRNCTAPGHHRSHRRIRAGSGDSLGIRIHQAGNPA
jgi:hypothetical protein